ncbi:hypothetical protein [Marinicella gelatinilytica]|uniref:hypothetical protein n=1 Tax=Marinicella gelatinilytica TaxID=2996017 RepID=UPI0022608946|nr:hypothetical protein [Marinicella gelatinilytica]MCX7544317.1 hypothetical protein [Marinicella gelatinilytica]
MFRKSVSFFILVSLFWVLLWVYIPDATPGQLSFTDFLRGLLLLFSFSAFLFALIMLFIRFFGVDIISRWIPHTATIWWLGQHAYRFSQPKITLQLNYIGQQKNIQIVINNGDKKFTTKLKPQRSENVVIGVLKSNPDIGIKYPDKTTQKHALNIQHLVKRMGKNMTFVVTIDDSGLNYHRQQAQTASLIDHE